MYVFYLGTLFVPFFVSVNFRLYASVITYGLAHQFVEQTVFRPHQSKVVASHLQRGFRTLIFRIFGTCSLLVNQLDLKINDKNNIEFKWSQYA